MNLIGMLSVDELFKGRHFDREIIVLCVRWYPSYQALLADKPRMEIAAVEPKIRHDHLPLGMAHKEQPQYLPQQR
jgi:hypothetical protein